MSKCKYLEAAMEEVKYPNNLREWQQTWCKLIQAVKREPNLRVLDQRKYDMLLELSKDYGRYANAFFFEFNLEDEPDYTGIRIAVVGDCNILSLVKGSEGQYVEFYDGCTVMRLGKTYAIDDQRLNFYQADMIYVDFYNSTGKPHRMKVGLADEVWCNEDGTREYFHYTKKVIKGISDIFNSL